MKNKITIYKDTLTKHGITDIKEFMVWHLAGAYPSRIKRLSETPVDELVEKDIKDQETEAGRKFEDFDVVNTARFYAKMFLSQPK